MPPDYFSETGQLWGHPLYRWEVMAEDGYAWWIDRFRMAFTQADVVRIDHFRGFYNYWEVPAGEKTAIKGRWLYGPGADLFHAVTDALGEVAIIAEDLGDFDAESRAGVDALQEEFGYPGMKVLQFAFGCRPERSLPAPQLYPRLGGLHRHPRQRHDRGLVRGRPPPRRSGTMPASTWAAMAPTSPGT